jgi:tetratricopeptide (TPR) repeat protein
MTEIEATLGSDQPSSTLALHPVSYVVSAMLVAMFYSALFGYLQFGGAFVDGLDDQIGEVVAARAVGLTNAGLDEQAESTYRQALENRFDDEPRQRIWTSQRYAKLLLSRGKAADAAAVMEYAFLLDEGDGPSYTLLFDALRQSRRLDRAVAVSVAYADTMRATGNANAEKWARYNIGVVYRDSGNPAAALDAFLASYAAVPSQENAWQIACLLRQLGRDAEAVPYLNYVVQHGDAKFAALARNLQEVKPERN